jgi:hypothetical protein
MRVCIVLGCWGREDNNFISCSSVKNCILDITKNTTRNIDIADYLDKNFSLFDKPLYTNVHTVLWNLQEKFSELGNPVFQEKYFRQMEDFCITHKKCGVYLKLELKEV